MVPHENLTGQTPRRTGHSSENMNREPTIDEQTPPTIENSTAEPPLESPDPVTLLGRAIMEDSSVAVVIVDKEGLPVSANAAAIEYLDLDDEYLGGRLEEVAPGAISILSNTTDPGGARIDIPTRGGTQRRLRYVSRPMGDGRHRVVLMRDETETIKREKRKRRASQLSIAGRMASHLSHQMKNPLSTLMAGLQGLEKDRDLSDDNRRMVELLVDEVRSMDLSLKQLLQAAVARMSSPSVVPVKRIVTEAAKGLQGGADARNTALAIIPGLEDATVTVDESALTQALRNLLQSSVEHVGPGDKLRCGWRRLGQGETAVRFPGFEGTVIGIFGEYTGGELQEESSVSEMFHAFGSSTRSAAGLGVSLARDIVESHGGVLALNSGPSRGMSFEILLSGAKPSPCWILVGNAQCSAETCEVFARAAERNDATAGALCRLIKEKARRDRDGIWPEACRNCPMFESFNLLHYYQSD